LKTKVEGDVMKSIHLRRLGRAGALLLAAIALATPAAAEIDPGTIKGRAVLDATGDPLAGVTVFVVRLGKSVQTGRAGEFEIANVPPGSYQVMALREHLTSTDKTVEVLPGQVATVEFSLALSAVHEEVTVTATAVGETTVYEAFNSITTLDTVELVSQMTGSLGSLLRDQAGVSERSFGPGSSRPIIRGFDGDRVLIMRDGIRTGDLSSQSGDHGLTIDPAGLERVEVVKGPATLLYGSNAIGGVVNAITPQENLRGMTFEGVRGHFTTDAGTANEQAGLNGSIQVGQGRWMMWAGGGGRRTGEVRTPLGTVENSQTRLSNGQVGLGFNGGRPFFSIGYHVEDARYGIPFAGELHGHDDGHGLGTHDDEADHDDELNVDLDARRHELRVVTGMQNLQNRLVESFRISGSYLDWRHQELVIEDGIEEVGTLFNNETFILRAEAFQHRAGRLTGRFGVWGKFRDFAATGLEALAPPTTQRGLAAFTYQEVDLGRHRLQFGGRFEHNRYLPGTREELAAHDDDDDDHHHENDDDHDEAVRRRSFSGASASAGFRTALGGNAAFVANLTRSFRAPALEELYNYGPHVGNLAFEIGNPNLERESSFGVDLSLRHRSHRARAELNAYVYSIDNFVFAAFTGEERDGLRVAHFEQGNSRFAGFDARGNIRLHDRLLLDVGAGFTNAVLTDTNEPLPRIPPFHGRVRVEMPWRGLTAGPEVVWASAQNRVYDEETPTDGYTTVNFNASWVVPTRQAAHILAFRAYNLTNETYRLHTSFIKDLAPEMGRGVRVSYSVRFF
jgi:iron complex outermembrane recepter protein